MVAVEDHLVPEAVAVAAVAGPVAEAPVTTIMEALVTAVAVAMVAGMTLKSKFYY